MAEINDLDPSDGNNTARFPENMAPSAVNDGARELEGLLARGLKDTIDGVVTTTGSSTAYVAAANRTISAYYDGLEMSLELHTAAGATPTLNVDSVGAQALVWPDGTAVSSDLPAGFCKVKYDLGNTRWIVLTVTAPPVSVSSATDTAEGLVELATDAETVTGTATDRAVTPANVKAAYVKQGVHTIFIPAGAMSPTVSNGCAALAQVETTAGRPDLNVLDFDATADEHAQFQVAFPESWNEGTVTFRAFWTTTATDTDGVAWGLQGVAVSDGDTADVAYGTAVVVTDDAQSAAEDVLVTDWSGDVTIAGTPAAGDMSFFRVFRDVSDANDDMTEDARLIGIQMRYTVNAADDS